MNSNTHSGRVGGYLEAQIKPFKRFFTIAGVRTDYHTLSKKSVVDPRLSMGWKFTKDMILRGAVGIYHQFPRLSIMRSPITLTSSLSRHRTIYSGMNLIRWKDCSFQG